MFLLEERDLLSQQLAAETSATPGQRGLPGQRVVSPVPYATPTTPSGGEHSRSTFDRKWSSKTFGALNLPTKSLEAS